MKIDKTQSGGVVIVLDAGETSLLRLALERASFIDTPPGRQDDILKFTDELLKATSPK